MPGICRSSRMTANSSRSSARSASAPDLATTVSTFRPSRASIAANAFRSSSSTINTLAGPGAASGNASLRQPVAEPLPPDRLPTSAGLTNGVCPLYGNSQNGNQVVDVHGFRNIVRRTCLDTLLPVALHGLGGYRNDRQLAVCGAGADLTNGFVTVHVGHHYVDQDDVDVRLRGQELQSASPAFRIGEFNAIFVEGAGQREDVADIVVDDHDLAARQHRRLAALADLGLGELRQLIDRLVQQKAGLLHQLISRTRNSDQPAKHPKPEAPIILSGHAVRGEDDDGRPPAGLLQDVDQLYGWKGCCAHHHAIWALAEGTRHHRGQIVCDLKICKALAQDLQGFALDANDGEASLGLFDKGLYPLEG